ncbi:unnamed protein product, partial [Tuber aestivum]
VGGLEHPYTKAPTNMKSFIMSPFHLADAAVSALDIAVLRPTLHPKLVSVISGSSVVTTASSIASGVLFRRYNESEKEMN